MTSLTSILIVALVLAAFVQARYLYTTSWRPFDITCKRNEVLFQYQSSYEALTRDRVWSFGCVLEQTSSEQCEWSGWVNNFGEPFTYECPRDKVTMGIASDHNFASFDRKFKFYCCSLQGKEVIECSYTPLKNQYHGIVNYRVPTGKVVAGMAGNFDSRKSDRIFRFRECSLQNRP